MKTSLLVAAIAASLLASPARAIEVGDCGVAKELLRTLAAQGQVVLADAQKPVKHGASRIRITGNADGSLGYVLTGDAKACIQSRLSGIRSSPGPARDERDVFEVRPQCAAPRADKAWCGSLDKAARKSRALDVVRLISVGPSQALAAVNGRSPPAVQEWSSAEYGFCNVGTGRLVLCISSHTMASGH